MVRKSYKIGEKRCIKLVSRDYKVGEKELKSWREGVIKLVRRGL